MLSKRSLKDGLRAGEMRSAATESSFIERHHQALTTLGLMACQGGLVAAIVFVSLGAFDWNFRIPLQFSDDALVYLAQCKSTFENGWWWVNPRQAAPSGLHALLFPSNSNVDQAIVWLLRGIFNSPMTATNFAWIAMLMLSGMSATFGLRSLGFSRIASLTAGTLFALSPYALYRNLGHFSLVTYLVPFPAVVAMQLSLGTVTNWKRSLVLLAGCVLLGFNYIYYAFFGCFFIALGAAAGCVASRDGRVLRAAGLWIGLIVVCAGLNYAPSVFANTREGAPIIVREKAPAEAEIYGLKIRQLVSPVFEHTFGPFRAWTRKEATAQFPLDTENMISRLGVVGTVGFATVIVAVLIFGGSGWMPPSVTSAGQLTIAGLLLATVGGFGSLFNLLVTTDIRGYNRVCPFLAFFALVAIAVAIDGVVARRRAAGAVLAAAVLTVGLWDQIQAIRPLAEGRAAIETEFLAVHHFVFAFEKAIPHGATVLQLPFTMYLNDSGYVRMRSYDHFKPYLVSLDAKWSYPAMSNRQFAWQEAAAQLDPADLSSLAAATGYQFILLDRYGYPDNAAAVLASLKAVSGVKFLLEGERYVAIDITKVAAPLTTVAGQPIDEFVADRPATSRLASCGSAPTFGLDRIGLQTLPPLAGPIDVDRTRDLAVAGWAVTPEGHALASDLEIAIDGTPFAAAYGFDRPDVAAYLKVPAAQRSGFRAFVPAASLMPGTHTLALRVQSRTQVCFHETQAIPFVVH